LGQPFACLTGESCGRPYSKDDRGDRYYLCDKTLPDALNDGRNEAYLKNDIQNIHIHLKNCIFAD
jgi:hypothetical protein